MRVLFVCLGNICRSPLAEGILRREVEKRRLDWTVDSAGTGDYHIGDLPDSRAIATGQKRGCRMDMRARQVRSKDFEDFDLVIGMDAENMRNLGRWHGARAEKLRWMRSFDAGATGLEVPDPYYGTLDDFEEVADQLEAAIAGLIEERTA